MKIMLRKAGMTLLIVLGLTIVVVSTGLGAYYLRGTDADSTEDLETARMGVLVDGTHEWYAGSFDNSGTALKYLLDKSEIEGLSSSRMSIEAKSIVPDSNIYKIILIVEYHPSKVGVSGDITGILASAGVESVLAWTNCEYTTWC